MMMRQTVSRILACLAALGFALVAVARSGEMRFRHYSVQQGLSDSYVTALAQDRTGRIWIGTQNGLNCFDGYSFQVFKHHPTDGNSLAGNNVQCLYVDRKGYIWIGLLEGRVSCYDPSMETFRNYICYFPTEAMNGDVSRITEDDEGFLWVTVDRRGLVRLNPETGGLVRYEHSDKNRNSLSHNAVTDLVRDRDGALWITSWGGGLDRFLPSEKRFGHYPLTENGSDDPRFRQLKCLLLHSDGELWCGSTYLGVFRRGLDGQWRNYRRSPDHTLGLRGDTVSALAEDAEGNIWIGTASGLSLYHPSSDTFSAVEEEDGEYGLHSREVTALFRDRDGSMWVGTPKGLHFYNSSIIKFDAVALPGGKLQTGLTQSVLKDREGRIWLRDEDGLVCLEEHPDGTVTSRKIHEGRTDTVGQCLYEDSSGFIWIGTRVDYVSRYNPATSTVEDIPLVPSGVAGAEPLRDVYGFYEDRDGNVWIATEIGLARYNKATSSLDEPLFRSRELIFPGDKATVVLRDADGTLWVGTKGGLKRFDPRSGNGRAYNAGDPGSLSDNDITALCQTHSGDIWVGTASGLDRYNAETDSFVSVKWQDAPSGVPVMGLTEDGRGRLWITTSSGIVAFDVRNGEFHVFDEDDGLLSRVFVRGSLCQSADGEILAGTISGTVRFRPETIDVEKRELNAYIDDFQIFNRHVAPGEGSVLEESVDLTDRIVLSHRQSTLSFRFVALDFLSPQKIRYAYRMDGVDEGWIRTQSGNRSATYANLSPGNYVFRVRTLDGQGILSEGEDKLEITVLPPFYRTKWAYASYILLALLLVWSVVYAYVRRIRRKNQLEMDRLMADQQHEMDELKLQLFTNISHEFRTSLTLILGPLDFMLKEADAGEKPLLEIMQRSATRLMRLVNQLLDFRKVEARKMEVHLSTQDMVPFLREVFDIYQFYAKEKQLDYTFSTTEETLVMDFDKDKVDKMVYNLLSNAFKYTEPGGRVSLELTRTSRDGAPFVSIRVSDDGIGISKEAIGQIFTRFYQVGERDARLRGGSGLGLNMTSEMAALLGGSISVESEPGKGSAFTILLPERVDGEVEPLVLPVPESAFVEEEVPVLPKEREKELILVVEDNPDMQTYIRSVIGQNYLSVPAANGVEGLEKAISLMPDIIISDIMMPEMDGTEFFHRLKQDERVSHIPVILLTALSDEQRIADSFGMGVDDYVTKPFSPTVLMARIANILARRKEMWEKKAYNENPFVVKLMDVILRDIADPSLGVDRLASELNMSAAQLTRKTKSMMDTTPYNLIIKLRMEQAVRLLKESDLNISEIADRCGYQEVSNFSRAFTRFWGESPIQYLRKYR